MYLHDYYVSKYQEFYELDMRKRQKRGLLRNFVSKRSERDLKPDSANEVRRRTAAWDIK